jgi:hypothetical protein
MTESKHLLLKEVEEITRLLRASGFHNEAADVELECASWMGASEPMRALVSFRRSEVYSKLRTIPVGQEYRESYTDALLMLKKGLESLDVL